MRHESIVSLGALAVVGSSPRAPSFPPVNWDHGNETMDSATDKGPVGRTFRASG